MLRLVSDVVARPCWQFELSLGDPGSAGDARPDVGDLEPPELTPAGARILLRIVQHAAARVDHDRAVIEELA